MFVCRLDPWILVVSNCCSTRPGCGPLSWTLQNTRHQTQRKTQDTVLIGISETRSTVQYIPRYCMCGSAAWRELEKGAAMRATVCTDCLAHHRYDSHCEQSTCAAAAALPVAIQSLEEVLAA